jgi:hypothetical protein
MRFRSRCAGLTLVIFLALSPNGGEARQAQAGARSSKVVNRPGELHSPDGTCHGAIKIGRGEAFILSVGRSGRAGFRADDVTGMAWVGGHTFVYTTSPIYGVPGVYVCRCGSNKAKRIVAPRTISKAYPDGEDFFELEGVSHGKPVTVYFYYAPDVDTVDFANFRTPAFLFQVQLDGTGFRKADPSKR